MIAAFLCIDFIQIVYVYILEFSRFLTSYDFNVVVLHLVFICMVEEILYLTISVTYLPIQFPPKHFLF